MRPQDGVAGLVQRFEKLEAQVARQSAMLGITSTSGTSPNLAGGGGLGAGFNFDGELIGYLDGHFAPLDFTGQPGGTALGPLTPITWTKVRSDYLDLTFSGARIQLPSDGFYMMLSGYREVWARRTRRAGGGAFDFGFVEGANGGNFVGFQFFSAISTAGLNTATPGTVAILGYGNAAALGANSAYYRNEPGDILPTRLEATVEIHRILEG